MKKLILALAVFNLTVLLHAQKTINITYIANDGFLISSESGNILIDALFNTSFGEYDVPSEQLRKEITEGKSPFGKINLYLVTHMHGDHFYAPYVIDFLKNHTETQFLSSDQGCQDLSHEEGIKKQLTAEL